jgi:hypothetical protein
MSDAINLVQITDGVAAATQCWKECMVNAYNKYEQGYHPEMLDVFWSLFLNLSGFINDSKNNIQ